MAKILVVDDETPVLQEILRILGGEGYKVTCVPSGEKALEELRASRYDLLLTDYDMGELTGPDLIGIVSGEDVMSKANQFFGESLEGYADFVEQYKKLPMILMTKDLSQGERNTVKLQGGTDCINKNWESPLIDRSELVSMVQKYTTH